MPVVKNDLLKDSYLFFIVLVASVIGYLLLMDEAISLIWLTNAIATGMLVRSYQVLSRRTLAICYLAMVTAGLLFGIPLHQCLGIHLINLFSIVIGHTMLRQFLYKKDTRSWLHHPDGFLKLFLFIQPALVIGSLLGGFVLHFLVSKPFSEAAITWYFDELLNYTILLPLVLVIPDLSQKKLPCKPLQITSMVLTLLVMIISIHYADKLTFLFLLVLLIPLFLCVALAGNIFLTTLTISLHGIYFFSCLIHISHSHKFDTLPAFYDFLRLSVAILAICGMTISCVLSERNYLITHDFLTDVLNRRAFNLAMSQASRRGNTPYALLVLDVDYFKRINDKFGHQVGDRVLISLCELFKRNLSKQAVIGRMGGEEFAILLTGMSNYHYEQVGKALVTAVQDNALNMGNDLSLSVTISCGLATALPGIDPGVLYQQADMAMYQAKQAGRNKLMLATENLTP